MLYFSPRRILARCCAATANSQPPPEQSTGDTRQRRKSRVFPTKGWCAAVLSVAVCNSLGGKVMDADEMRRKATECRQCAKAAVAPVAVDQWLEAAEQWDQLAREVDAWRARWAQPDDVPEIEGDKAIQ
jgi:hypothetical protein